MRKTFFTLGLLMFFGLLVGLYRHGRDESEGENEAPLAAASKLLPRENKTPVLDLQAGGVSAAGIEVTQVPSKDLEARLPGSAIVRVQDQTWIYLKLSETQFSRIQVEPLATSEQGLYRLSGIPRSAVTLTVVTVGAQILLSEELKSQIQVGDEG